MQSTRRPGRHKRGSDDAIRWPGGLWVGARYIRPIAGAESAPPKAGDDKPENDGKDGDGTQGDKPKPEDQPKFTQAQLDAIIADRLAREKAASERAAEKTRREAEERTAAEAGEHKKLAETRQERITALEGELAEAQTHKERADRYEAALTAHLDAQRKDLPKHVTELLDKLDVVDQLEWIAKNREQVVGAAGKNGPQASPRANGNPAADAVEENRKKLAATGAYGRF